MKSNSLQTVADRDVTCKLGMQDKVPGYTSKMTYFSFEIAIAEPLL